ncbi:MAG: hypothetical protein ACYTFY_14775 [Planctomycetota bacterium]
MHSNKFAYVISFAVLAAFMISVCGCPHATVMRNSVTAVGAGSDREEENRKEAERRAEESRKREEERKKKEEQKRRDEWNEGEQRIKDEAEAKGETYTPRPYVPPGTPSIGPTRIRRPPKPNKPTVRPRISRSSGGCR